jgi:hypothetical protein
MKKAVVIGIARAGQRKTKDDLIPNELETLQGINAEF